LRSNPTIASFKGNDWKEVGPVIAKSYVEARSVMGKKAYDLPQDDWKPEQWQAWHKTIGVPETHDKYPPIDDAMAEKAGLSKEILGTAFKKFHEAGMTPRQVKAVLHDWYLGDAVKGAEMQATQQKEANEKAISDLKAKYGDKFEARAGLVRSVLKLGGAGLAERIEAAGFGNDPQLFDALSSLGEKMLEDTAARGGKGVAALGPEAERADALREIDAITAERVANPTVDAKYNDPRSAEFKRRQELFAKAYPNKAA
jgi:hypothetical protein